MTAKKGPIYMLEAFRRAAARDPELHLDYVGGGELVDAAAQFVTACDLQGRVTLHGSASEATKARLLGECGVFVQHSLTDPATGDEEGLPASIQEAMANALAVISTRHAGIPEAVVHGETGLLVDEGDVGGMAEAMLAIGAVAAALGAAGRRRALANYGWPHERARLRRLAVRRGGRRRMSEPLVSVITPTRNRVEAAPETLDSVAAQTLPDWEHLVVDDGSDDGTAELMAARAAADPRVRYIVRQGPCSGANVCRNLGDPRGPRAVGRAARLRRRAGAGLPGAAARR